MADEAFDAFSQKRDTGTKARVKDTKVVETSTDPNRYRLPPNRRVRVVADQLDMTIDPEKEGLHRLAGALNKVKPDLYQTFTAQAIDENIEQVDLGKQAALTQTPGELNRLKDKIDNKWFQFGASAESAFQTGEDLSVKLALDMENRRRDVSYNEAYTAWWQENQPTDIDPQFMATFNNSFMPVADKVKNQDIKREYELNRANAMAKSTRNVVDTIIEARKNGHHILAALDALKQNEQAMYHFDNSTWNEVKFYAVTAAADELDDPRLLDVFTKSTFDQVTGQEIPGMAYTTEYQVKIRNYQDKLIRQNDARDAQAKTEQARLETKMRVTDTDFQKDIKMHVGDDGYLRNLTVDKATQVRARSYLTSKVYTDAVKRLQKENNLDGTAKYPAGDEKKQMELRELAKKEAISHATENSWSNDVLVEERRKQNLVAKNNEVALNTLYDSEAGKEDLIKYYRMTMLSRAGDTVPQELMYALPFDASPELREVALKMGENEYMIKSLNERITILRSENANRRQDRYGEKLESLTQQLEEQEAIRAGLTSDGVEKPKDVEEIKAKVQRDKAAEFPELEEMFYAENGGLSTISKMNSQLEKRYSAFKNNVTALKYLSSGKSVQVPAQYDSWDEVREATAKEREFFAELSEKRRFKRDGPLEETTKE